MLPGARRLLSTPLRLSLFLLPLVTVLCGAQPARDCNAHFVDADGREIVAPCGQPIRATGKAAVGWIETADRITPFFTDISRGSDLPLEHLVPAASVAFPRDRQLGAGERIRLVSLVPPRNGAPLQSLFVRDVFSLDSKLKFPAGKAIALLLDRRGRALAASRPIVLRAGADNLVWPESNATPGTLIAWLNRPRPAERDDDDAVALRVDAKAPDEAVNAANALIAVWYDLPAGNVRLLADSVTLRLARDSLDHARGAATLFEEPLLIRPTLTVAIAANDEILPESMTLTIAEAVDAARSLRTLLVEPGKSYPIEHIPAALLTVELRIGDVLLEKRADLSSGADAHLTIPLEPLKVSGTVFYGDAPARATLRFLQKGKPLIVRTDDRGEYAVTLWQPQRSIIETILADRPEMAPFSEMVSITTSGTIDINVPANTLRVRVYDAADGKPLTAGEIMIQSRWSDAGRSRSAVNTVAVNGPITELPPQRSGTTEIRVRAAGYSDSGPISVAVDDTLRDRLLEIPMTRSTETADVVILLDGASPAAGAEIGAFSGGQMTWHGTADEAGRIAIPDGVAQSRVIIRHPSAASDVVVFGSLAGAQQISLVPAAPPLLVKVLRRNGTAIGSTAAQISLWLAGGVRLTGVEAAFATWSLAATSPNGTFVARGLRAGPFRLFATRNASHAQIRTGTFDRLATTIPYPWPAAASVTLVHE